MRFSLALIPILALLLLPPSADAQQGKRASTEDVSRAVRGDAQQPYGPTNLPRPEETEDGRAYIYMEVVFVTAVRDRRPARVYSFWPRITMAKDAPSAAFRKGLPIMRDALTLALAEVTQIDWPGELQLDAALASQAARERADAALGGGVVDEVEFMHIEVQAY